MSAARKGFYFKRLKAAGVPLSRHFRDYKLDELMEAHSAAVEQGLLDAPTPAELEEVESRAHAAKVRKATTEAAKQAEQLQAPEPPPADWFTQNIPGVDESPEPASAAVPTTTSPPPAPPVAAKPDPREMAGQRQNTNADLTQVIRIDDQGRHWLQEEVRKPAYPKPRGRRVLRYQDPGVRKETMVTGDYTESFEVAGDPSTAIPAEVKITLPSFQVGIYTTRQFPFRVVTYGGNQGFDRDDVIAFYGGAELVPDECKRIYVENVLCYDMRSVIRAIRVEHRQQQLAGNIK
jgi:hypothetical protein